MPVEATHMHSTPATNATASSKATAIATAIATATATASASVLQRLPQPLASGVYSVIKSHGQHTERTGK